MAVNIYIRKIIKCSVQQFYLWKGEKQRKINMKLVEGRKQYVEEQNNQCYKNRKQCRKEKKKNLPYSQIV